MGRRRKDDFTPLVAMLFLPVVLFMLVATYIAKLLVSLSILVVSLYRKYKIESTYRSLNVYNVDSLSGYEFEEFLLRLLQSRGYTAKRIGGSGDLGVDIIAKDGRSKIAVQAKRYSGNVSRRAISDAVAGAIHYNCNVSMVITSNYYTNGAKKLADSTGCILIDRDDLAKWINERDNNPQSPSCVI